MSDQQRLALNDAPEGTVSLPQRRLLLLFAVSVAAAAGNTGLQSLMPSLGAALRMSDVLVTMAYSWPAALWVVFAPIWARRSDRRGRKGMILLGLFGFTISCALCAVVIRAGTSGALSGAVTLALFALFRIVYCVLGSAAPPAAQAYVASRTPRSGRMKALTLLGSAYGLGTVLGPALAPLLVLPWLGLATPLVMFTVLGIAMVLAVQLMLPDDRPAFAAQGLAIAEPSSGAAGQVPLADPGEAVADAFTHLRFTDPRLRGWMIAGVLGGHAHSALIGIGGFLVIDRLALRASPELAAGPVGLVMTAGAAATLLAQWGLIPMLKLGPRSAALWGLALGALGTLALGFSLEFNAIVLAFALASLGFGLFRPGFAAGASLAVTRGEQGQVAGYVTAANGIGFILGPVVGLWLYGHAPILGFAAIAALCLVVIAVTLRALAPDQSELPAG